MARTHLFLALADAPWGELLYAARIAAQLTAHGDRVVFAGPPGAALLLAGQPIQFEPLPPQNQRVDWLALVQGLVARERCDSLILVDLAIAYTHFEIAGIDATFLDAVGVPVIALDVWDLDCTNLLMERGTAGWILSRHCREVTRRLIPSPMIRPTGWRDALSAGVYNSLPDETPPPAKRGELRARLGVGDDERLIAFPTATWQQPAVDSTDRYVARLTQRTPELIAQRLALLGENVRVIHVGARAMPELAARLGARYKWVRQLPRGAFIEVLAASDLLLSFNSVATTIGTAATLGLPVLLGINSHGGATREEIAATLPFTATTATLEWLSSMAPLHPFRVWPYGLYRFAAPIVQDNACVEMTRRFELLDEQGFVAAARALLYDANAIAEARARMAACLSAVRALPSAVEVVAHHLA